MAANAPGIPGNAHGRPRLGELLVEAGCITQAELELAVRDQRAWGGRLGQNLVDAGLIDERTLATAVAGQLGLKLVDLERAPLDGAVVRLVPLWVAERYGLVAMAVDRGEGRVLVACADPTSNDAMREVRRTTGLLPATCVATATQIDRAVRRHYYGEADPAPSPDPQLDVTRNALRVAPEGGDRLDGLERRIDRLLDLVAPEAPRRH
jgi:type IV pilus assembly protein PilB